MNRWGPFKPTVVLLYIAVVLSVTTPYSVKGKRDVSIIEHILVPDITKCRYPLVFTGTPILTYTSAGGSYTVNPGVHHGRL